MNLMETWIKIKLMQGNQQKTKEKSRDKFNKKNLVEICRARSLKYNQYIHMICTRAVDICAVCTGELKTQKAYKAHKTVRRT